MTWTRERKYWWIISVHGYGEFNFMGTEQQAEEMRRHKANWEGAVAKKRRGRLAQWGKPYTLEQHAKRRAMIDLPKERT